MIDPNANFCETAAARSVLDLAQQLEKVCYIQDHDVLPEARALFTKCFRALRLICISYGFGDYLTCDPQPGAKFQRKVK